MTHDMNDTTPESAGLLLALKGWSRGCAAAARREFARSLGRKRLTGADLEAFAAACLAARRSVSAATCVAALVLAARPVAGHADILRGSSYAAPRAAGGQDAGAQALARQRQAAQVQRAREALARTTQALQSLRLAQDAARSAAMLNAGNVTNGIAPGGLVVAAGVGADPTLWQNANGPVQTVSGGHTQVEIVQTGAKAILTWDSFNIGKDTEVYFNQKAGGADAPQWIALNRVTDASLNPTQILGSIRAEGQVYVINPNGVIFNGSSQVNAQALVASGLDFKGATIADRNAAFQQGLAADDNRANYNLGVDAGSGAKVGDVTVQAGARLEAGPDGAIYLFGKNVSNAGTITAPGGQALMAAGDRIWITKNSLGITHDQANPDLRGIRASVQNDTPESAGKTTNSGIIEAARGNVTLSAKSVENSGALVATTTTKTNGSITLTAGDGAAPHDYWWMFPTAFGDLTLKPGSLVAVTPDTSKGTAFATQYRASVVDLYGQTIVMESGASVYAPSAKVSLVARTHTTDATAANDPSRIYLAEGSSIFLAGLPEVEVAMSRNTITGTLRLDELKDSPLQRDGALRGAKVSVDLRQGTTLADMSGYYGLIEYGVEELMTSGGTLKLDSGAIVTRAGSDIDLSGGSVKYLDGMVTTTRLRGADGRLYDITNARKDIVYTGVYDTVNRFEAGYLEGKNAGALILGPQLSLDPNSYPESLNKTGEGNRPYFLAFEGSVTAGTTVGKYQRTAYDAVANLQQSWKNLAHSASLTVGYEENAVYYGPSVRIGTPDALPSGFGATSSFDIAGAHDLVLPASFFDGNNFGHVSVVSGVGGGVFAVNAGTVMNLGAFGSLEVHAAQALIDGGIVSRGGSVSILADIATGWNRSGGGLVNWNTLDEASRPRIALGAGTRIDVSGGWVNEALSGLATGALAVNGGGISLISVYDLTLAQGVVLDVSGGGRLTANNTLLGGNAGAIVLENDLLPSVGFGGGVPSTPSGDFDILGVDLRGFALGKGGSLAVGASRAVVITTATGSAGTGASDPMNLAPEFFSRGGFADYSIAGTGGLTIAAGTEIAPHVVKYVATAALRSLATEGSIRDVVTKGVDTAAGYLPVDAAGYRDFAGFVNGFTRRADGSTQNGYAASDLRETMSLTFANVLRDENGKFNFVGAAETVGHIDMQVGSRITLDPGSSVSLYSLGNLTVNGAITTPGGAITLGMRPTGPAVLRLGDSAVLSATGAVRSTFENGKIVRSVLAGGTVAILSDNPGGMTDRIETATGSRIDVSGIAGMAEFKNATGSVVGGPLTYSTALVAGDAGDITFDGFRNGYIAGALDARAAGTNAAGGAVAIRAGDLNSNWTGTGILLTERTTSRTGADLFSGATTPQNGGDTVVVYAPSLSASGADDIELAARTRVAFDGDITLAARRSLSIASPVLGIASDAPADSHIALRASYVSFSGYRNVGDDTLFPVPGIPSAPATLAGTLSVTGDLIDIRQTLDLGGNGLGGFDTARFVSAGDIRLTVGYGTQPVGRLQTPGALILESAQTYVTTANAPRAANDPGFLVSSGHSVVFTGNGAAAPAPYSYGEKLTVRAPDIVQGGVLRAPLGSISLEATNSLTLTAGSLTSVSAEGKIMPIGSVAGGFVSPFPLRDNTLENLLAANPEKSVGLAGKSVSVNNGATIDVSGGGDLAAYEFIPGNGGSRDILNTPGMFAVLPGYVTPGAPRYAKSDLADPSLKAGDSVYLAGVKGLADGVYTLLPAHYALLAGGFAVKVVDSGFAGASAATTLADGSQIVSGHRTVANSTVREAGTSRFSVMSGKTLRAYSAYNEYAYGETLAAAATKAGVTVPRLPSDAGNLVIRATDTLALDGRGLFGAAAGGRLGNLDIDAAKIAVVGDTGVAAAGYLALDAKSLSDFGVGSLLLGGTRAASTTGTTLVVNATDILVSNDAASALVLPELILAAKSGVTVTDGSVIRAAGAVADANSDLLIAGNGALLRVSTGARTGVSRSNSDITSGDLSLGDNVTIAATGSVQLDGTRSVTNRESTVITAPQLALSSAKVSLGDAPGGTGGLVLSGATLTALSGASDLLLRSYGAIDVYGAASLGATDSAGRPVLGKLTLDAAGLFGFGTAGETATFAAKTVTLSNAFGAAIASPAAGTGNIAILADTLSVGSGGFVTQGFAGARVDADRVGGSGKGSWTQSGDLTLATDLLTAGAGADTRLVATGAVSAVQGRGTVQTPGDFGGRLAISGTTVSLDTTIGLPAGIFEATATGGDLELGDNARLSTKGVATNFFDVTRFSDAGTVRLTSATGAVTVAAGASIDVSGANAGGSAGRIEITATRDAVVVAGTLAGSAAAGNAGGSFVVDAGNLSNFAALNTKLNTGGFDAERSVRTRTGDMTLAVGETISAHDVALRADTGEVTVAGDIRAAGTAANRDGGTVALRGGSGVTLAGGARIDVSTAYASSAKGFDTQSGKVEVLADSGDTTFASGATILGAGGVRGGASVVFTAQRDGADLRIADFSGSVSGFRELIVGGRRDYSLTNVTTADFNTMFADATAWMAGAEAIKARLGNASVEIRPDIRVVSTGDLTIANDVSLNTRRYGADTSVPGALGFEAAGDLAINGSVSDGFSTAATTGALLAGRSWDLAFTAGRDITLAADKLVRTGTGDIALDAGRDLVLTNTKSVIYTAGSKTADAAGYVRGSRPGEYPVAGGDLAIRAGRDINTPLTKDFVTAWLYRYGFANNTEGVADTQLTVGAQSGWSVVYANFEQGVGALGGGNVRIGAGGDIRDLAVALPTSGQQTAAVGASVLSAPLVVRGGGNLDITAGANLYGGLYMAGRGEVNISAGDSVTADLQSQQRTTPTVPLSAANDASVFAPRDLHALFAISDAALTLRARDSVQVEAIVDAMMIPSIASNRTQNLNAVSFFNSYTDRSSAEITATSGDVTYLDNPWAGADLAKDNATATRQIHQRMSVPANSSSDNSMVNDMLYLPGTVGMTAAQGSVALIKRFGDSNPLPNQAFRLAPAKAGNLEILASKGITAELPVILTDIADAYFRNGYSPFRATSKANQTAGPNIPLLLAKTDIPGPATNYGRGASPLHAGDTTPVRLYVTAGDIAGIDEAVDRFFLYAPKSARVMASGNIADLTLHVQHNRDDADSVVSAGKDILRPVITVTGGGSLEVAAGRDIDLTSTAVNASIISRGNVGDLVTTQTLSGNLLEIYPNLALPNRGADITLVAGAAGADYAGFADKYVNPANAAGAIRAYTPELREFMAGHGVTGDDAALYTAFEALPETERHAFLFEVYLTELKETGIDVTNPDSPRFGSYKRGFDAAKIFFGASTPENTGDIRLFGRSVATQQGGDITVLAPHGSLAIDVITNPAASSQGVITQKGGDIRIMTEGDIALANSRVFTLQGGDILMWTSKGDITAGSGSTTRAIPPALVYTVDNDANVLLNAGSLQTGAGIGVLDANRVGGNTSRLDLVAPAGTVDAGDAGIRSVGKINIAALRVVNAANISAGAGVTGVSAAPTVNIAAVASANSASGQSSAGAGDAAQKAQERAAEARSEAPSIFTVEILGYGGSEEDAAGTRVSSATGNNGIPRS